MDLDIRIQERQITHYVGLHSIARLTEFGDPGGPNSLIPRVFGWLADNDIAPLSGPLYIYRRIGEPSNPIDLTVAIPVAAPVEPSSGLVLGSLPAGRYVVGRHVGHPDGIAASQREVMQWAEAQQFDLDVLHDGDGDVWAARADHFLTDPAQVPDASQWVTELIFKIR